MIVDISIPGSWIKIIIEYSKFFSNDFKTIVHIVLKYKKIVLVHEINKKSNGIEYHIFSKAKIKEEQ